MATRTIITDDLDGTDAWRTIRFSYDGKLFEIDLSRENYESFKKGLTPWIEAGREVSKYANKPATPGGAREPRPPARSRDESVAIREWAKSKGIPVTVSGIIRREIVEAYEAAHRTPQEPSPQAPKPHPPAPTA